MKIEDCKVGMRVRCPGLMEGTISAVGKSAVLVEDGVCEWTQGPDQIAPIDDDDPIPLPVAGDIVRLLSSGAEGFVELDAIEARLAALEQK